MIKSKHILFLQAVFTGLLLTGCTKEPDAGQPVGQTPAETVKAMFDLTRDFEQTIEVKATGTENVSTIKDLWIIQMAPDGSKLLQAPVYIPNGSVKAQGSDFKIEVELLSAPSKIAFVANSNSSSLYSSLTLASSEADVAAPIKSTPSEAALFNGLGLPMSGTWSGTPSGGNFSGRVGMSRACARVTFTVGAELPAGDSYELQRVQVRQVPNRIWFYRDDSATPDYPFPSLAKNLMVDYAAQTVTGVKFDGAGNTQTFMWYLPENCRGIGTAPDQLHKTTETAPAGQSDMCTYIELFGRYTTAEGQTTKATYRIFLGGNNTTDYNLLRNHAYTVNVTLRGQNVSDMRVIVKATTLAYTDDPDNSRFLLSDEDVCVDLSGSGTIRTYDQWMTGSGTGTDGSLCPEGWRMPTQKELMLLLAVLPGIPDHGLLSDNYGYWSSTAYSNANLTGWFLSINDKEIAPIAQSSPKHLRCVKNTDSGAKKYPYLSSVTIDGTKYPLIVSRDEDGGIVEDALLAASWKSYLTSSPTYIYGYDVACNRISPKFAVYNDDNSVYTTQTTGAGSCPAGWRPPTIRELSLIWVMGGCASTKNENISSKGNTVGGEELLTGWPAGYTELYYMQSSSEIERYWSSTSGNGNTMRVLGTITGRLSGYSYSSTGRTRCIKDVD